MVVRIVGGHIKTSFRLVDGVTVGCMGGDTRVTVASILPATAVSALPGRPFHDFLEHPAIGRVATPIVRAETDATSSSVWLDA